MQDLTSLNTLALASRANTFLAYRDAGQLPLVSQLIDRYGQPFILGGGSNVVLMPRLQRPVVHVVSRGIQVLEQTATHRLVQVAAGENWHDWVAWCVAQGWGGLENLALIPGTVGAAPVQNIGAYGLELETRIQSLQVWDIRAGKEITFRPEDCAFAYRDSLFKQAPAGRWMILSVTFRLPTRWEPLLDYPDLQQDSTLAERGSAMTPADVFDAVCRIRRAKLPDPATLPNAGSFFKNPVVDDAQYQTLKQRWPQLRAFGTGDGRWKLAAGWLIEQAGWKGKRMGAVGMHERQALVLVNHGLATAHDVQALARQVQSDVLAQFGVMLEQEPVTVC